MKPISERKRADIMALINQKLSSRGISKRVGVSHSAVCKIRKANNPEADVSKGGRPRVVTPQLRRLIVREITSGQSPTAENVRKKLHENCGVDLSAESVRNALRNVGMKGAPKQKKPKLSARHIKARLDFARKYSSWTIDDWKRVIWSDETKINRLGSDGRLWCWKNPGERPKRQHVKETLKFGGGSLMVWGCMLYSGVGWMCRIDGGLDAQLYTEILDSYVKKSAKYYKLDPARMIFQQDNDPKHTSRSAL
jgi:transposase